MRKKSGNLFNDPPIYAYLELNVCIWVCVNVSVYIRVCVYVCVFLQPLHYGQYVA